MMVFRRLNNEIPPNQKEKMTRKITVLSISKGNTWNRSYYDAFGNIMESSISEDISYQYNGQEFDEETKFYNYKARLYDSELMRFYAVDPQGQLLLLTYSAVTPPLCTPS